jgi:ribosomal protein S18 acetylase RimI-like enzyme
LKLHPLVKRLGKFAVVRLQRTPVYRKLADPIKKNIRITEADERDSGFVHSWLNPDFSEPMAPPSPNTTDYVAKKGKKIVGFVQLVRRSEDFKAEAGHWLFGLWVKPIYRNIGIGMALSQKVIEKAQEEGAKELLLLVHEDNQNAIKLYRKLDFKFKVLPGVEEMLEREKTITGRKRVVMGKSFI